MIPFNFHHLYYFYMVANEGSVSKAAAVLRLSQPALSTQLKQLEAYWGFRLFDREARRVSLTEEGHNVLSYAKAIFDLGQELSDSLGDRSSKEHLKIQIGVSSFIPKAIVDTFIKFILNETPKPYLTLIESKSEDMIEDLKTHKLDLVLSDLPHQAPSDEGIQNHVLAKIPIVFCAHKSLANKYKHLPKDLNNAPMILPTAQSQTYHLLQEYFISQKISPRVIAEIQDVELARRLVIAKEGIAPLNEFTVLNAPTKEELAILGSGHSKFQIHDTIYLIKKNRKYPHPLVVKIIDQFKLPRERGNSTVSHHSKSTL